MLYFLDPVTDPIAGLLGIVENEQIRSAGLHTDRDPVGQQPTNVWLNRTEYARRELLIPDVIQSPEIQLVVFARIPDAESDPWRVRKKIVQFVSASSFYCSVINNG